MQTAIQITKWKKVKNYSFNTSLSFISGLIEPLRASWNHIVEFKAVVDGDKKTVKVYIRDLYIKDDENENIK